MKSARSLAKAHARPPAAHQRVLMALKAAILDGDFPVGTLLPAEETLMTRFHVSRVPLREGVKQLEAMGWLKMERGTGTRVHEPGFAAIESTLDFLARFEVVRFEHLHQLRRLIEVDVAGAVASSRPKGLVASLRAANAQLRRDYESAHGYVDADLAFHDVLISASPNPLYPRLLAGFRSYMRISRRRSYSGPAAVLETVNAHEAVIVAIERGDVAAARAAMSEHLSVTARQLRP